MLVIRETSSRISNSEDYSMYSYIRAMTLQEKYELCEQIDGIKPGKMFGALCMKKPNGKAACMFWKEHMVFKVVDEAVLKQGCLTDL